MKWFSKVLLALSVIPLQSIVLEKLQIGGIKPDLALVWVFFQGWFFGAVKGLYWGAALGGLLDLFSIGVLGLNLVAKGLAGLAAGLLGKAFVHLSPPLHLLIFFSVSVVHDLAGMLFLHGAEMDVLRTGLETTLARALYTSLFGMGYILFLRTMTGNRRELSHGGTFFSAGRSRFRR